ncbi:Epsin-3, clathrin recruitment and traffic between the Golgi and endosome [Coemansia guatemalensis]|uniref:Epsin-3, clathrin recruitment and traffic between the Golgi and endosome n=1 Tax=Coemansia guatemalensis TaxID=2761395 RepID=A0A9W8HQE9_9FUNG|nr:Epsin-3, clathrin recruitment and traffic between the Golgi and endosome [Coemansia guatemalensis]
MDLNNLTDISVWDVRNVYNKVKNVVMNYSEMEVKVNEATGPEPWGAPSTLMRELADATYNRKDFDDIMPMIYMKFNDTDPSNWRPVYKALQLIEYLVKNGAERVVEDVRSHITIVKMLKNFHHIDANGKDQGINVRHRSKEIVDLINDDERLREERKKSKANRNKYGGYAGGSRMSGFGNTSSSRGGSGFSSSGFGSSTTGFGSRYGGLSGGDYMASGSRYDDRSDSNSRSDSGGRSTPSTTAALASRKSTRQLTPVDTRAKDPEVADLFSFDDDDGTGNAPSTAPAVSAPPGGNFMDSLIPSVAAPTAPAKPNTSSAIFTAPAAPDDDWGDFQGAGSSTNLPVASSAPSYAQPSQQSALAAKPAASSDAAIDLLGDDGVGMSFQPLPTSAAAQSNPSTLTSATSANPKSEGKPAQKAAFSDIWDMNSDLLALDSLSLSKKSKPAQSQQNVSMNQLANQSRPGF